MLFKLLSFYSLNGTDSNINTFEIPLGKYFYEIP